MCIFRFPDQECRRTAVQWMDSISDPELLDFLPQLVQVPWTCCLLSLFYIHTPSLFCMWYIVAVMCQSFLSFFPSSGAEVWVLPGQSSGALPVAQSHWRRACRSLPFLVCPPSVLHTILTSSILWNLIIHTHTCTCQCHTASPSQHE